MSLGKRMHIIIKEQNITQVEFSNMLGISSNYVNQLISGKKTSISCSLAKLIEAYYGYSAQWILDGTGEKKVSGSLSAEKSELIRKIRSMPDDEVVYLLAFVNSLESIKKEKNLAK